MHIIPQTHPLYIIGDYHQTPSVLLRRLAKIEDSSIPSSLVMLGDYLANSRSDILELRAILADYDINAYLLRGNEDNPVFWQDRELASELETDRFKLLREVDALQWGEHHFLTVNGALSVGRNGTHNPLISADPRWPKTEGQPANALSQVKAIMLDEGLLNGFDTLLAHTAGAIDCPQNTQLLEWFGSDDDLAEYHRLDGERRSIQDILELCGARSFYLSHFRKSDVFQHSGVTTRSLDFCEMTQVYKDQQGMPNSDLSHETHEAHEKKAQLKCAEMMEKINDRHHILPSNMYGGIATAMYAYSLLDKDERQYRFMELIAEDRIGCHDDGIEDYHEWIEAALMDTLQAAPHPCEPEAEFEDCCVMTANIPDDTETVVHYDVSGGMSREAFMESLYIEPYSSEEGNDSPPRD